LCVTAKLIRSAVIVSVAGEVDASNEHAWSQLLSEMATATTVPGPFIVDVRDLDFMACCAVNALARESERCRRRGIGLCLVGCQPIVARTVAICGLRWVLPVHPTVEAALSRATAKPVLL
jgi:anti-anti-sigma factor